MKSDRAIENWTISSISIENYKTFPGRKSIEIRPLTILIGRNSSGKSVLARLPLLINRALSTSADAPFDLEFEGLDFGSSYTDLIHNHIKHGKFGVGAGFASESGERVKFWAEIQHFDEYKLLFVSRFEFRHSALPALVLRWTGKDPLKESRSYRIGDSEKCCQVSFSGLLPRILQGLTKEDMNSINDSIESFSKNREKITYLGPFREDPQRSYRFPGGAPGSVGIRGTRAPELLADDFLRRGGKLLEAVGEWFAEHLGGWALDLSQHGDRFSLVMRNPEVSSVDVNIADVGTGIAQILPIVVQRRLGGKSGLEIVEQPELHLHPAAHGDLADLYVEAVNETGDRFLVETHSENFLLRLRNRIASGTLDPRKVIIYWVNDSAGSGQGVRPIEIFEDGEVSDWPAGVFSEDFEEVRAIRAAQRDRQ